jgi:hypothetical protein
MIRRRAFDLQVAEAQAMGASVPNRSNGAIYGALKEGGEVFDINSGE